MGQAKGPALSAELIIRLMNEFVTSEAKYKSSMDCIDETFENCLLKVIQGMSVEAYVQMPT